MHLVRHVHQTFRFRYRFYTYDQCDEGRTGSGLRQVNCVIVVERPLRLEETESIAGPESKKYVFAKHPETLLYAYAGFKGERNVGKAAVGKTGNPLAGIAEIGGAGISVQGLVTDAQTGIGVNFAQIFTIEHVKQQA